MIKDTRRRGGGWNKKSVEQHKLDGTYDASRHGPDLSKSPFLKQKPKARPKRQCGKGVKWIRSAADEKAIAEGCYFDNKLADYFVKFIETNLKHSKGRWAGQAFDLAKWQRDDVIKPLFGWLRPNGTRRFRRSFVYIPKKNGKSTLASAIGLAMLVADNEPGAEVYSVASDREQASITHGEALNMVDASEALSTYLKTNRSNRNIYYPAAKAKYQAVSARPQGNQGQNSHCLIIDELHAWKGAAGRDLWDALAYAGRSRLEPLIFVITTAGDDLQSICYEQYEYAKAVLNGDIEDQRFFAYICEATKEDDIDDPATWKKANPSIGLTFDADEFEADLTAAKRSPSRLASFSRYSLNIWASSENPWLDMDAWQECEEDYTEDDLIGEPCFGGLDLAKSKDTTSLVLMFPDPVEPGAYRQLAYFWLPEETVEDRRHLVNYTDWVKKGYVKLSGGHECDYNILRDDIIEIASKFNVQAIAFDPWNARTLINELDGQYGFECVKFRQQISNYAEPTAEYERLVLGRKLKHNVNPLLSWQAGNVRVKEDDNKNKRPVKQKGSDIRTIDGIVAGVMALGVATEEQVFQGPGVWS